MIEPNNKVWDGWSTHSQLMHLIVARGQFRLRRTYERIRSPRRLLATSVAVAFFALYILNGLFILSARQPADPERLQLWLSGGMVLYAIYHCVRCAWSHNTSDLELTPAEQLWLGGAPIRRSSLAVYHISTMLLPTLLKTLLLAVVLAQDVEHLELLLFGVFSSLLLLETSRLIVARVIAGLSDRWRRRFRITATLIAASVGVQLIARILALTPEGSSTWAYLLNGFRALGETASCDIIQWLAIPWIAGSQVSVASAYHLLTMLQIAASAMVLPLAILILIQADAWCLRQVEFRERRRLADGRVKTRQSERDAIAVPATNKVWQSLQARTPSWALDLLVVTQRQWITVRRYHRSILMSFSVPTVLCLLPLTTGQTLEQWFFVVGGIGMCTMMLAPPALRIDFRRDLRRMLLLRSLPVKPVSMVMGQLLLPVLITLAFQWFTIAVAAFMIGPGSAQVLLWTGMLSALAVFTFAGENALFLAYPHFEQTEGVAMMLRAKLTFLGKATIIATSMGLLFLWAIVCKGSLPESWVAPTFVSGSILATWFAALVALTAATLCWRRFDPAADTPPQ